MKQILATAALVLSLAALGTVTSLPPGTVAKTSAAAAHGFDWMRQHALPRAACRNAVLAVVGVRCATLGAPSAQEAGR
jgi:hypothetical protein